MFMGMGVGMGTGIIRIWFSPGFDQGQRFFMTRSIDAIEDTIMQSKTA
jgi:hypothetical protein